MDKLDQLIGSRIEARLGGIADRITAKIDSLVDLALDRAFGGDRPAAPAAQPSKPAKRRAGPKPPKTASKRFKAKDAPAASPKRPEPLTPKAAIVQLLEAGPLTAEEFGDALSKIPESVGTHEAKRQALARLAKAGTVQKLPNGGYQLARPT